jgi:hypothetical protein
MRNRPWKSGHAVALIVTSLVAAVTELEAQDGRNIRVGRDSFVVSLVRGGDTVRTGWSTDEIVVQRQGDDEVLMRVFTTQDQVLGSRTDTIRDRRSDLSPITYSSRGDRGEVFVVFSPGRATGWLRDMRGDSTVLSIDAAGTVINAASFDLVVRSSSLAAGYTASWQGVVPQSRAVATLTARVAGSESIDGELCWRVEANMGASAPTFWISQQTRKMRLMSLQAAPGVTLLLRAIGE